MSTCYCGYDIYMIRVLDLEDLAPIIAGLKITIQ
jgi:hypothetical protein